MGMRERDVLWRVELPVALPVIANGLRSAGVQVVATATLGAIARSPAVRRLAPVLAAVCEQTRSPRSRISRTASSVETLTRRFGWPGETRTG